MTDSTESPIVGILETESESERVQAEGTKAESLSVSDVEKKAHDKYNMMEVPTERKVAEDHAKLGGQIQTADTHRVIAIQQGEAHPEHQTYGVLGLPMRAQRHDFDKDRNVTTSTKVVGKDDEDTKKHNATIKKIEDNINKENEKK